MTRSASRSGSALYPFAPHTEARFEADRTGRTFGNFPLYTQGRLSRLAGATHSPVQPNTAIPHDRDHSLPHLRCPLRPNAATRTSPADRPNDCVALITFQLNKYPPRTRRDVSTSQRDLQARCKSAPHAQGCLHPPAAHQMFDHIHPALAGKSRRSSWRAPRPAHPLAGAGMTRTALP
jgi:hypothetical protein